MRLEISLRQIYTVERKSSFSWDFYLLIEAIMALKEAKCSARLFVWSEEVGFFKHFKKATQRLQFVSF